ncbi:MAG: leucine dehydrogenase [Chloroflexota bacterium]|nr:leucine dehydrogenase [Chloroflexota bacterium]
MAIIDHTVTITPNSSLFPSLVSGGYEQLLFCHDRVSGLRAILAIHNTTLGPALGGIRMRPYASEQEALVDVLRLSRAMTYKSALAGLDLGGGKSVIIGDQSMKSEALFRAMGQFIQSLGGRYICATDVGTTSDDLTYVRAETPWVTGISEAWGGLGDTSVLTGLTVYLGMKAGAEAVWGSDSLAGKRVMVQGAGKVGAHLMEHLTEEGASLLVSDISEVAMRRAAERFHAELVPPDRVFDAECDIFSPNALGNVLNDETIPRLRCKLVCGGANNQLGEERHGEELHRRGILYAPDYAVNSGGVISAESEILHAPRARAEAVAARVGETMRRVFALSRAENIAPSEAADRLAEERLERIAAVHRPYIAADARHHRALLP